MASLVGERAAWEEDLARLVADTGSRYQYLDDDGIVMVGEGFGGVPEAMAVEAADEVFYQANGVLLEPRDVNAGGADVKVSGGHAEPPPAAESLKDMMDCFFKASGELMMELGISCGEIGRQRFGGVEDSCVLKNVRSACVFAASRLEFLNDYLPEDRDPKHAWPVVIFVFFLALIALILGSDNHSPIEPPKKVFIHPPTASHVRLPDGRNLSYTQLGVPPERARFPIVAPHSFLSSRLAGIPGIKPTLLEEFGVHLITYDLPGFGESDPHPGRNLNSSAVDMLSLANALGVKDKFWVLAHSSGGVHAWAALRYIPNNVAGAILFAPIVNPYEQSMTKEEKRKTWGKWTSKRKFLYILARKFPSLLPYFYSKTFLSGEHGDPEIFLSLSLTKKDKALLSKPYFKEFWERNVEESIRQGDSRPFVEESVLQVSDWEFTLADIQVPKNPEENGLLNWLKSFYSSSHKETGGFTGPIHVWQGTDDKVVPPATMDYIRRVLPAVAVHRLAGEGHFSYFFFCDECHRHMFSAIFGIPQGPLNDMAEDHTASVRPPNEEAVGSFANEMK